MAYKGLVRPILEYVSPVWDPSGKTLQDELEKVQNPAAWFITGNYNFETGNMTKILGHLKWKSLKQRWKSSRLILFYKGLKGQASIPLLTLKPLLSTLETIIQNHFKSSMLGLMLIGIFSFLKLLDWNTLHASNISSAECSENCTSRFTSLMRSRD